MKTLKQSIILIPIVILIIALTLGAYTLTFPLSPGQFQSKWKICLRR